MGKMVAKTPGLEMALFVLINQCCLCYQASKEEFQMGAGTEWIQCARTNWLHEYCVVNCIIETVARRGSVSIETLLS